MAVSAVLLTGCLIPESFKAKADFASNGDYTFSYDGTAVHAMAAAEEKKTGSLRAQDEEGLKSEATKMKKDPMVQSAEYLGHGRYQLKLLAKKKAGENLKMMDIFSVTHAKDGVITISSPKLSAKDVQELTKLGIKIDGTLEVVLPKNATIISHNATSEPKFFGLFGTCAWKIGSLEQRPEMKIKLN
ncbi:hypothetical protein C798_23525 [Herbaspirillum rubrisubalbicans Os34]|uniref:Uncharacterized protein n=2 Tax=Herbaspirillum rubrisubalbicans TaxID=80842 RepID=A0A6M3ZYR6_9BURK|nr:hypothetical protein C798_23525 [Herbaspirillum rubrisubalbicans Os34]